MNLKSFKTCKLVHIVKTTDFFHHNYQPVLCSCSPDGSVTLCRRASDGGANIHGYLRPIVPGSEDAHSREALHVNTYFVWFGLLFDKCRFEH